MIVGMKNYSHESFAYLQLMLDAPSDVFSFMINPADASLVAGKLNLRCRARLGIYELVAC
jgi:hypothetical protein